MYAIIEDSGSQFKVSEGDVIEVDLRQVDEDADQPEAIEFDRVLMIGDDDGEPKIGSPLVDGAKVSGEVLSEDRAAKVTIIKYRRRKTYRRKKGHRQRYLKVRITGIAA